MTEIQTNVIVAGYQSDTNQYLTYLIEGDVEDRAVVEVDSKNLKLFVPKEWIETGNSLVWMTKEQLTSPTVDAEDPSGGSFQFTI
ncbi:hypothetical protein COJ01_18130 [Priestia megaterium]|uniref:hypothetical protein n=1 Tax=Priestia megaterium TaxID=1404 RepID=UPI000BF438B5|nr:hypothetical protein [Priestia megaterium]PFK99963.1 hypothetical protein COJ01_18130 [Priestia megaterium]